MIRTRVGYAGGTTPSPTYRAIGDHSETIQIDFDPAVIGYEELLDVFWDSHRPTSAPWSQQYKSAIFFHDARQEELAKRTRDAEAARLGTKIFTEIVPAGRFTRAEDYHQKYRLRNTPALMREFAAVFESDRDFVDSTAAARVNGLLDGYGKLETFAKELPERIRKQLRG